jgi:hypothetical protein
MFWPAAATGPAVQFKECLIEYDVALFPIASSVSDVGAVYVTRGSRDTGSCRRSIAGALRLAD